MSTNFTNKNISSIKINDVKYNIKSAFFHAKESEWKTEELNSYIPKQGEIVIYDIDDVYAYERFKIGDGVQNVIDLPFYNDGFVSYYETQTLTDEQKAQARENLSIDDPYGWVEIDENGSVLGTIPTGPLVITDIASASEVANPVGSETNALSRFFYYSQYLFKMKPYATGQFSSTVGNISRCFNALISNGCITDSPYAATDYVFCYSADNVRDSNKWSYFTITYMSSSNQLLIRDSINTTRSVGILLTDGSVYYDGLFNFDTTLSKTGYAADAKAVGDALALKADQTSLDEVSVLVGDTAVSEQITTAITNSVADWNQNDETAADYIKNKPDIATDDEIISMLTEEDMLPVVADSDGVILADESDNILLW